MGKEKNTLHYLPSVSELRKKYCFFDRQQQTATFSCPSKLLVVHNIPQYLKQHFVPSTMREKLKNCRRVSAVAGLTSIRV